MRKSAVAIMLLVASAAFYLAGPVESDVRTPAPQATDSVPGKVLSKAQEPARKQTALLAMENLGSGDKR